MAFINKYRFVDFIYGEHKNRIMTNEVFSPQGRSMQVEATNTAGKSISIMTILQAIVPFTDTNKSALDVYTLARPFYMLIEWITEDGTKVLSGIGMVRKQQNFSDDDKRQDKSKLFDYLSFVVEYDKANPFDIDTIELIYEENERLYCKSIAEVTKMFENVDKKTLGVKYIKHYTRSYLKEYKLKLKEYGIYPDEWADIIVKLNKEEAVLSKYFDQNKTTENLMRNVIIPAVEENINRPRIETKSIERIKDIQEDLKKYQQYVAEHKNEIEKYEDLQLISKEIEEISKSLDELILSETEQSEAKIKLGMFYNLLCLNIEDYRSEINNINTAIEEHKRKNRELVHQKLSFQYLEEQNKINKLIEDQSKITNLIVDINDKIQEIKKQIDICDLKEYVIFLDEVDNDLGKYLAEKEKHEKSEAELSEKLNIIGHSIKNFYNCEIETNENECTILEDENIKNIEAIFSVKQNIDQLQSKGKALYGKYIGKVEWLKTYNQEEFKLVSNYPKLMEYIVPVLNGKDYNIDIFLKNLDEQYNKNKFTIDSINSTITNLNNILKESEKEVERIKYENISLITKLASIDKDIKKYEDRKKDLTDSLIKYDIASDIFDKESLYKKIDNIINEKEIRQEKLKERLVALNKEILFLKGNAITITKQVKEEFEALGIDVVTGLDWLLKQDISLDKKKSIYNNNPLFIYSLLLTSNEYETLKKSNILAQESQPIPLVLRKDIDDNNPQNLMMILNNENKIWEFNNIEGLQNLKFMVFYDSDMLDVEVLNERIIRLSSNYKDLESTISNNKYELEAIQGLKRTIKDFEYDIQYISKITEDRNITMKTLDTNNSQNEQLKSKIPLKKLELVATHSELDSAKNTSEDIKYELTLIKDFNNNFCKLYNSVYIEIKDLETSIKNVDLEIQNLKIQEDSLQQQKETNVRSLITKQEKIKVLKEEVKKYVSYNSCDIINGSISSLIGQYDELIRSTKAGELSVIKEKIGKLETKKLELTIKIGKLKSKIGNIDLANIPDIKKSQLEKRIENLDKDKEHNIGVKGSLVGTINEKNSGLCELLKNIRNTCDSEPLRPEEIKLIADFDSEINNISNMLVDCNNLISQTNEKINYLSRLTFSLKEYENLSNDLYRILDYNEIDEELNTLKTCLEKLKNKKDNQVSNLNSKQSALLPLLKDERNDIYNALINAASFKDKKELCNIIILSIQADIDKLLISKQEIENDRQFNFNSIKSYIDEIIKGIRRLSDIAKISGERLMKITIKDENIDYNEIYNIIDKITDDDQIIISNVVTSYYLLNRIAKVTRIKVEILQYELYDKRLLLWDELGAKTTGAQKFCISFILLSVLMEYKRFDERYIGRRSLGKVLIMDNPFGEISETKLLEPVFKLAEKLKVQFISYTHIQNQAIRDRFNKIYLLKVAKLPSGREITELRKIKDSINETTDASKFFSEQTTFDTI